MKTISTFLVLLSFCIDTSAQLLPIKIYTTRDGLSSNVVQSILQDNKGIIWFGTNNGLNWYDGTHIFSPPIGAQGAQIFVNNLYEDSQKNIWVCSYYSGLYKFDGTKFQSFLPDSLKRESSCNNIFNILQLDSNHYLVATDCNLYIFDGIHFSLFDPKNNLLSGQITRICLSSNRDLFIIKGQDILSYQYVNNSWRFKQCQLKRVKVNDLLVKDNKCWLASDNGLYIITANDLLSGNENFEILLKGKKIFHLYKDRLSDIWCTGEKIYKLSGHSIITYGIENGLPGADMQGVCIDEEGNTWFASLGGVTRMSNECIKYYDLSKRILTEKYTLIAQKDSIITALDKLSKQQISYLFFLLKDKSNRLWAGTSSGLFQLNNNSLALKHDDIPRAMYIDDNEVGWIAEQNGKIIRMANGDFQQIKTPFSFSDLPLAIYQDQAGFIWVGCATSGIIKFQRKGDSLVVIKEYNSSSGFSNLRVRCVIDDHKGNLLFGTRTNGVFVVSTKDDRPPLIINNDNGLPASWIKQMTLTDQGNILLASNTGLFELKSYDYDHPQVELIPFINDKVPTELNGIFKDQNYYWLTADNGIIQYLPSQQRKNTLAPKVYFTKVMIEGKNDTNFLPYSSQQKALQLSYQNNNISIEFTTTSFALESSVRYRYMLEGADKQWGQPSRNNSINYSHLKPGSYAFKVEAANNDGVWSMEPSTFAFVISTPFWQRWWFILLLVVIIGWILYSLYRYRMKQFLKLQNLRTNISTDLHDDIGSTLSSISILSEIALRQKEPGAGEEMVAEIRQNSISLMERMDDIVWSINPKNDTLENLLMRVSNFASKLFEAKDIDYTINIEEGIKSVKLPMEYRQHIYLILKEGINNIVKYSQCARSTIKVSRQHSILELELTDDGRGFDTRVKSSGNGLTNMRRRASLMKADIVINSSSLGTAIQLSVRLK